jgi:hypothetical protein
MPDTYDTLIPDEVWEQSGFLFPRPGSRVRTTPIKSLFQKLLNRDEYIKKVVGRLAGTTNWDDIPPSNIQSLFNQLGSLNTQLNALNTNLTQHKTAAVLDHPDSSVTDSKIGNRTINDNLFPTTDTNNLTTLLSNLANRIKSITGSTGWKDNPPDTLINLNNTVARKGVNETITGAWTFNNNVVSSQTITASRFISTVASGTAPLVVTSNTRVANLNADLLDGYDSVDFPRKAEGATITGNWTFNGDLTIQQGRYIRYNSNFRVMYPRWGFATNAGSSANKWQKIGTFTFTGNYQKCHIHAIIWAGRDADDAYATQHLVMEIDTGNTPSIVTTSYILGLYLEHAATSGTTDFAIKDARIVIPDPTNYPNVAELWVQWNVSWALISPEVRLIGPNSVTVSLNTDLTDDANLASTSPPSTGTVLTPNHTSISDLANRLATARTISLGGSLSGSTSFDGSSNVTINASINAGAVGTTQLANGSVTAPKLATGAITGSLGYTPLDRAGDIMTGMLTVAPNIGEALSLKGGSSDHVYLGFYARSANQNARSGYIGYGAAGSDVLNIVNERPGSLVAVNGTILPIERGIVNFNSNWNSYTTPGYYQVIDAGSSAANTPPATYPYGVLSVIKAGTAITQFYTQHIGSGTFVRQIYDSGWGPWVELSNNFTNRFVVSAFAGQDISIPANNSIFLVNLFINIPSGKSLYIRRVRSYIGANLRFRISTFNTWTASDPVFESDVNTLIVSGSFAGAVAFGFTNLAASPETLNRGFGAWAEMEIR